MNSDKHDYFLTPARTYATTITGSRKVRSRKKGKGWSGTRVKKAEVTALALRGVAWARAGGAGSYRRARNGNHK